MRLVRKNGGLTTYDIALISIIIKQNAVKIVADLSADSIKLIIGEHINNAYALFMGSFFGANI